MATDANQITDQFVQDLEKMLHDSEGWKSEGVQKDTKVFSRAMPNTSLKAWKYETEWTGCSPKDLEDLLHTKMVERHKEWNETFVEGKYFDKTDENTNTQYWRYKVTGLSDRDFVVSRRKIARSDGSVLVIDKSIEHPSAPVVKGVIRCDLPFNVRYWKPISDSKLEFKYMNMTDIKGWVPTWLANSSNPSVSIKEMDHIKKLVQGTGH
mmetsp:Transcript_7659/g.10574  ORF Transcript_7659/g.10574 Transcript_7659/m.10574 type:complete len:209 (-) Transcript_7659:60-686(-)